MQFKPHDYQQQVIKYICDHPQAAIFLDMGLGKTASTLSALTQLMYDSFEVTRALIIAPKRVAATTWPDEIQKWGHTRHLPYALATGTAKERKKALNQRAPITIINRENIVWLVDQYGVKNWPFDTVIIDELSSFKTGKTKRFRALRSVRPKIRRIIGLTGTPAPNSLIDLWAEYRLLDEGKRLGRGITKYRNTYFDPGKRNQTQIFTYTPKPGAEKAIYSLIGDMTISMKTADHLTLPPLTTTQTNVRMSETEYAKYQRFQDELVLQLDGQTLTASNAGVLAGKLSQLASGAIYAGDDGQYEQLHQRKLDALEDIIEAANGQPVLIAYWFKHDRDRIKDRFPSAIDLTDEAQIRAWNSREIQIGLIHPASAGHGLNLQKGGSHLVWFSLTWSLELYQQANARLYRQGQKDPVVIQHIVTEGTIDQRVMSALTTKATTQNQLIEAVKAQLGGNK